MWTVGRKQVNRQWSHPRFREGTTYFVFGRKGSLIVESGRLVPKYSPYGGSRTIWYGVAVHQLQRICVSWTCLWAVLLSYRQQMFRCRLHLPSCHFSYLLSWLFQQCLFNSFCSWLEGSGYFWDYPAGLFLESRLVSLVCRSRA